MNGREEGKATVRGTGKFEQARSERRQSSPLLVDQINFKVNSRGIPVALGIGRHITLGDDSRGDLLRYEAS